MVFAPLVCWLGQWTSGRINDVPQGAFSVIGHLPDLRDSVMRRTTRELVAEKIAGLIAAGIVRIGDALPSERDLATSFQVSRETVRGGIQILAARGVIEVSQGARTRVISTDLGPMAPGVTETRRINEYDIETVHAARMLVEREVVAAAAREIRQDDLNFLRRCLETSCAAASRRRNRRRPTRCGS